VVDQGPTICGFVFFLQGSFEIVFVFDFAFDFEFDFDFVCLPENHREKQELYSYHHPSLSIVIFFLAFHFFTFQIITKKETLGSVERLGGGCCRSRGLPFIS